jgi:translation initiation factor 2 gamma subunit (eIF-2gamma)
MNEGIPPWTYLARTCDKVTKQHFEEVRLNMLKRFNFADEAVRNCNTNPRRANTVADAQVEPEIAKTKETQ